MALVKTASGHTPDRPWEPMLGIDFASTFDVIEWKDTAVRLRDLAFRKLYELGDVETAIAGTRKAGEPTYPRYEEMRALYEPLNAQVGGWDRLFDPFNFSSVFTEEWVKGNKAMLADIANASVDLACLVERIDNEIQLYGVSPTSVVPPVTGGKGKTDPGADGMGILGTAAVLAAGIGAVWLGIAISRRTAPAPKEGT